MVGADITEYRFGKNHPPLLLSQATPDQAALVNGIARAGDEEKIRTHCTEWTFPHSKSSAPNTAWRLWNTGTEGRVLTS